MTSFGPYRVHCQAPGCTKLAEFKIASRWSDDQTEELKTYSLCCRCCLDEEFAIASRKQSACRLAEHEQLDLPEIFPLKASQDSH